MSRAGRSRPAHRTVGLAVMAVAAAAATATPAVADGDYGPDTCLNGFVWREAVPTDHVCVTPDVRSQTRQDNALAASRRSPTGGPFGPDTCRQGYVWREAVVDDHVCVTPSTRDQARTDNLNAAPRRNELRTSVRPSGTRFLVQTDRINTGPAHVNLYDSRTRKRLRTWPVTVPTNKAAPGGLLVVRLSVQRCVGPANAYFRVRDGSSTRSSRAVLVCVTL